MISQQRLEKAMVYLAESDEAYAEARMAMEQAEDRAKAVRNAFFLHSEGTVAERTAKAESSQEYQDARGLYYVALLVHDGIRNKRDTETLVVDVWRSIEASRRKS